MSVCHRQATCATISSHLCYCVLNQTLPRVPLHKVYICCVMVYLRMPIRISAPALVSVVCRMFVDTPTTQKQIACDYEFAKHKTLMIELTIRLQYLIVLAISRVPLLLHNTGNTRVPLHFQCHFIACAASSSLNSRVFAISARANPTSPALITFQEIKTGTQPYGYTYVCTYAYMYMPSSS